MDRVRRLDPNKDWKEISIVLTDDAGIAPVSRKYLTNPDVTDVISFCYDPMPGDNGLFSAEVIVNVQRAADRVKGPARRDGWHVSRELALYIAHGCDHLAGETDYDRAGRDRMRRRELRWLKQAADEGLTYQLLR